MERAGIPEREQVRLVRAMKTGKTREIKPSCPAHLGVSAPSAFEGNFEGMSYDEDPEREPSIFWQLERFYPWFVVRGGQPFIQIWQRVENHPLQFYRNARVYEERR
jgi:hypothetical protein